MDILVFCQSCTRRPHPGEGGAEDDCCADCFGDGVFLNDLAMDEEDV